MSYTKHTIIISIIFLLLVLTTLTTTAQTTSQNGCCCDPVGKTGSIMTQTTCTSLNRQFFTVTNLASVSCDTVCQQNLPTTQPQPTPTCDNPVARAPINLVAQPVKGDRAVRLDFTLPCTTDYVNISRCEGTGCTNFQSIDLIPPQQFYVDTSPHLKWSQAYTYRVVARYNLVGNSDPAFISINTGDIECGYQTGFGQFCVDHTTYSTFENYLKTQGYLTTQPQTFITNFDAAINNLFSGRYRTAFTCDANNKLSSPHLTCTAGQLCTASGGIAHCVDTTTDCTQPSNIFGLFSTTENCEGTTTKKYCFLDKSFSIIDTCYPCNQQLACYDYKSETACNHDNCGRGPCTWKPVLGDIGIGVCIDQRFNNCPFCSQQGTVTAPNKQAFNEIFDQCTQIKAQALSTNKNPCLYKDAPEGQSNAISCDTITCKDYLTKTACAADLFHGITLNADNSLATPSTDSCSIRSCQWDDTLGCVKNADGTRTTEPHWQDCDTPACEKDYFPPQTTIIPTGSHGRYDFLLIKILDQTERTKPAQEKQGTQGYTTFVCTYPSGGTPCTNFQQTTSTKLNLNDNTLMLQDGTTPLTPLIVGTNKIRYYSTDPNKNIEVMHETPFTACANCSGPKIINFSVSHSRTINSITYTSDMTPIINVVFNKPAKISASLNSTYFIPLATKPSGFDVEFTITPTSTQPLAEEVYTFTLNAQDQTNHYMDEPLVQPIVIRTSRATVQITPPDKTAITSNSVPITLTFSEQVTLTNITTEEEIFTSDYVKKKIFTEITNKFITSDNKTYTTTLAGLVDGKKTVKITAQDLTGSTITAASTFFINTQPPQILLAKPRFGIAPAYTFNITVETTTSKGITSPPAITCKWVYDTPTPPPSIDFANFANFDTEIDNQHTILRFTKIQNEDVAQHQLHIYCKDNKGLITQKTFKLSVDTLAPNIITAFASPNPIKEEHLPGSQTYLTTLKVQTNKNTFCKYSATTSDFDTMEGYFQGYEETPSTTSTADIIVTDPKTYTYFVQCQSIAGIPATGKVVTFNVDTNQQFTAKSTTPTLFNTSTVSLTLETNKRAYCYYSANSQSITDCMGTCNFSTIHTQDITVSQQGNATYYAQCTRPATGETTPVTPIKFFVDTTPPQMQYVNDTSVLIDQPEISPYKDKLLTSFLATDQETQVTQYLISIQQASTSAYIFNATSVHLDGQHFFIPEAGTLSLLDKEKYFIHVRPVNLVGLIGNEMVSNGVTTDFSKQTAGKITGEACSQDIECISNYCNNGRCQQAACNDGNKNGLETDTDCGGNCDHCALEKHCRADNDCTSKSCQAGICRDLGPCFDAMLTPGFDSETDIDCGGACPQKCAEGKKCKQNTDCDSTLTCYQDTCKKQGFMDADNDGIPDNQDTCPATPLGQKVDEHGCADTQKFSLGDEIPDSWRLANFKCIDCAEAAADADPDNDGTTNREEYKLGTNPNDPNDPPRKTFLHYLSWFFLILLILAALSISGYFLYEYYLTHQQKKPPVRFISVTPHHMQQIPQLPTTKSTPAPKLPFLSDKIETLRKLVKPTSTTPTAPEENDWASLSELRKSSRAATQKQQKETTTTPAFKKLRELRTTSTQKTTTTQKAFDATAFEKMRAIALNNLSPQERKELLTKFKLLKQNKLAPADIEKLFKKLRITAQYYKTNKTTLEKELQTWPRKK